MKKIAAIISIFISIFSFGQDRLQKKLSVAEKSAENKDYKQAIKNYKSLSRNVKSKGIYFYYVARFSRLDANEKQFLKYIRKAIDYSPQYYSVFSRDSIFRMCSQQDLGLIKKKYERSCKMHGWLDVKDSAAIDTLEKLRGKDQYYRNMISQYYANGGDYVSFKVKYDSLMKLQGHLDSLNQVSLDAIIKRTGWPDLANTNMEAMMNAFLVATHCADIQKKKKYMALYKKSMEIHNAPYQYYAVLVDEVRNRSGKKQLFGTIKVVEDSSATKKPGVKFPKYLNKRRIKYGLSPVN